MVGSYLPLSALPSPVYYYLSHLARFSMPLQPYSRPSTPSSTIPLPLIQADNIVILSESKAAPVDVLSSKSREGSDDYHALMLTMKVLSLDFHINSIVALHDQQNSRFLPASIKVRSNPATVKSSKCRRRATEMVGAFTPASVIGQVSINTCACPRGCPWACCSPPATCRRLCGFWHDCQ